MPFVVVQNRIVHVQNMAKTKALSLNDRIKIVNLRSSGLPYRAIAAKVGCCIGTVSNILKQHRETRSVQPKSRNVEKKKLSTKDERYLQLLSVRDRRATIPILMEMYNASMQVKVSRSTVQRALKRRGLIGRVAARKPYLRPNNVKKRLTFALAHKDWTVQQWSNVLFTDESKYELFGNMKRAFVRRRKGEKYLDQCLIPTVKHGGGSIMLWGCVSKKGVGDLVLIKGIMDKYQ